MLNQAPSSEASAIEHFTAAQAEPADVDSLRTQSLQPEIETMQQQEVENNTACIVGSVAIGLLAIGAGIYSTRNDGITNSDRSRSS